MFIDTNLLVVVFAASIVCFVDAKRPWESDDSPFAFDVDYQPIRTKVWLSDKILKLKDKTWPDKLRERLLDLAIGKGKELGEGVQLPLEVQLNRHPLQIDIDNLEAEKGLRLSSGFNWLYSGGKDYKKRRQEEGVEDYGESTIHKVDINDTDLVVFINEAQQGSGAECGRVVQKLGKNDSKYIDPNNPEYEVKGGQGVLAWAKAYQYNDFRFYDSGDSYRRPVVIAMTVCPESLIHESAMDTLTHELLHGLGVDKVDFENFHFLTDSITEDYIMGAKEKQNKGSFTRHMLHIDFIPHTAFAMSELFNCPKLKESGVKGYEFEDAGHPDSRINAGSLTKRAVMNGFWRNILSPVTIGFLHDQRFFTATEKHMQQMQKELLGENYVYTAEVPKVTLTEKLARNMVNRKPPYRFASDSKLIKKAYDHYWYGKAAGCAFITDQQREYTLKRLKQYDQLRHAPAYPYCSSLDVLKEMEYLTSKSLGQKSPFPHGSLSPMCIDGVVVGHIRCVMVDSTGMHAKTNKKTGQKIKGSEKKRFQNFWDYHVPYSYDINKWLENEDFDWLTSNRINEMYMKYLPISPGDMNFTTFFEPVNPDGDPVSDWDDLKPYGRGAQPCYCNQEGTHLKCDEHEHAAVPYLDDNFKSPMTQKQIWEYKKAAHDVKWMPKSGRKEQSKYALILCLCFILITSIFC